MKPIPLVLSLAAIAAIAACATKLPKITPLTLISCPADYTPHEDLPKGATRARATAFEIPRWQKGWGPMNAKALAIIDASGRVKPDSVMVCGLDAYPERAKVIAQAVASMHFVPAMLDGQPIRSTYPVSYFERDSEKR